MEFQKGELVQQLKQLGKTDQTGTKLSFKPDSDIFPDTKFSFDVLSKRLQQLAFLTAGVRLKLIDERSNQSEEFFYEDGIVAFVEYLNRTSTPILPEVIRMSGEGEVEKGIIQVDVAIQHNDSSTDNVRAFTNNIYNPDGGTHLSGFKTALTRTINNYGKKHNLFKDFTPIGDDFREGLTAVISIRHPDPHFNAQPKEKLVATDAEGIVNSIVGEKLSKYFEENPTIAKTIVQKGLVAAEARIAAKKAREMVIKEKSVTTGGLPDKLRDCRSREPRFYRVISCGR